MGFAAGALKSYTEPLLRRQQQDEAQREAIRAAIAQIALQGFLDPNTDPALRAQYQQVLEGMPGFESISGLQVPESVQARLTREVGPTLDVAKYAGALGGAGLLTPELAAQLETILGKPFFPRRDIEVPGPPITEEIEEFALPRGTAPVLPSVREVTRPGPPTTQRVLDLSRFEAREFLVEIPGVGRMPASDAAKIIGTEGMRDLLLRGITGTGVRINVPGVGWMDIADAAKTIGTEGVRNILGIEAPTTEEQKTRSQAMEAYRATLDRTGDPAQAWLAAGRVRPDLFRPDLPSVSERLSADEARQFERARLAYVTALQRGASVDEAYNVAFAIFPKFPTPATLPTAPAALSPQQQVWADFFGGKPLNSNAQAYITAQLRGSQEDTEFAEAIRVLSTIDPLEPKPTEVALRERALEIVAAKLGVPTETVEAAPRSRFQRLWDAVLGREPPTPTRRPVAPDAWARRQLENFKTTGHHALGRTPRTKADFQRLFNLARRDPRFKDVPLAFWRALQVLIGQSP